MSSKARALSPDIYQYIESVSLRPPAQMDALLEATKQSPHARMASAAVQGQLLGFLIRAIGAKRAIEVGVFTGVGAMWMADALPADGTLIACDVSEEFTSIGKPHWQAAGLADRIDLRIGPATDTLTALFDTEGPGSFDFAYVDADKVGYDGYYEQLLPLLRPGGIVAFDNMLLGDRILNADSDDPAVVALRALGAKLHTDDRVDVSFLPMCDGLYLARKR